MKRWSMRKELLLEILSEEIPSRFQRSAIKNSKSIILKILNKHCLEFSDVTTHVSVRRIAIIVKDLSCSADRLIEEKRGPKLDAPESAVTGFLNSNGKSKSDLLEKDGYFYLSVERRIKDIAEIIQQVISEFIELMPWPKSMRWYLLEQKKLSAPWVRPIRSILCIYDGSPLHTFIESVGITTCGHTYGHRFLSPDKFDVIDFEDYSKKLESKYVIIDFDKKVSFINDELNQKSATMGLHLLSDQELLDEIAGLVEYPFVHIGAIGEEFMKLPQPVLSTSMKVNQKYFTLTYPDLTIAPFFGTVTNIPCTQTICDGLERVLRARLSDAVFFYKEDTDVTLEAFAQRLSNVVFHEKLGSLAQKVDRMMSIASTKDEHRTIVLCKADLLTQMVGEFPELQGAIGEIYAKVQDECEEVAVAIREHYRPLGSNDRLPETRIGARVSFFDKLDTLVGFIGVGILPSGSKDPFALRRAALAVIRLLCDSKHDILDGETMSWYIDTLVSSYSEQGLALDHDTTRSVQEFIIERLKWYMADRLSIDQSVVDLVVKSSDVLDFDYKRALVTARKLDEFSKREGFQTIKSAYRRASGIVDGEQCSYANLSEVNTKNDRLQNVLDRMKALDALDEKDDLFEQCVELSELILDACENVLINDKDQDVRRHNLSLLHAFQQLVVENIGPVA
jgi:glycyl-tRNA synthetase beta chain